MQKGYVTNCYQRVLIMFIHRIVLLKIKKKDGAEWLAIGRL